MKKARIVLSIVALFALVGGAFAFKAAKFNGFRAFTSTTSYSTFGTVYTIAAPVCMPITPARFITNVGQVPTTVYSSTTVTTTTPVVLTQVGGTATITFPSYVCTSLNTFTTVLN